MHRLTALLFLVPALAGAGVDDWPQFRGTQASGLAGNHRTATEWDVPSGKNVRFKTAIPGLGHGDGALDLDSAAMAEAEAADADVADFVWRARDWQAAWIEETLAAGDGIWEEGCGW